MVVPYLVHVPSTYVRTLNDFQADMVIYDLQKEI